MKVDINQISLFEYYPSLFPNLSNNDITVLQLKKIYDHFFELKMFRKKIECRDIDGVIKHMKFYTENGVLGIGVGWSKNNPTVVNIDKRGVEFDNNGKYHSFKKVALLLIKLFA